jgi:ubiquinone/menaquinone biosynthesis C-methylase UbiE
MNNAFSNISAGYQKKAVLQEAASQRLFELLGLRRGDSVLDLGCGPGHITRKIRDMVTGTVFGVDPSEAMIAKARRNCQALAVSFLVSDAESFQTNQTFDRIFCNSAFQWFRDPAKALANCAQVLKPGGRIGIQAPARANYCPNFVRAIDALMGDSRTRQAISRFRSPWFFMETEDDYAQLFQAAGLTPAYCTIEETNELCLPDKVMTVFESGAAAGYLNPDCYDVALDWDFFDTARRIIRASFQAQADQNGKVPLNFSRLYLIAEKSED